MGPQLNHTNKIDSMQNKALRFCIGSINSTPSNAVLVEPREIPIDFRRDQIGGCGNENTTKG